MKLYHGTNDKYLNDILKNGILPRKKTNNSNWDDLASNENFVYLTDSYALFYALNSIKDDDSKPVIIEVDVNIERLYPDEDFLGQVSLHKNLIPEGVSLKDYTLSIDIGTYGMFEALESLKYLGTCAIEQILVNDIKKYAIIDNKEVIIHGGDPTISIINYKFLSKFYIELNRYIFGYNSYPDKYGIEIYSIYNKEKEYLEFKNKMNKREGIKVVTL